MGLADRVRVMWPAAATVPPRWRIEPVEQREYLVGGVLRRWEGPLQRVLSPICLDDGAGPRRAELGAYPLLTEPEALAALEAAVAAWADGRGAWPTASLAERASCVEEFTRRLAGVREEVAGLLMWETGKTAADSEREFERTLRYLAATVEAAKDMERASSRLESQEGIFGQARRAPLGVALCLGPYNYPLNETLATLIPAIIMGNPVIYKPPRLGVLLHRPLLGLFRDCFPPGVVNTVYGEGERVVAPLMASGKIGVLAFIGTSRVAGLLRGQHPAPHRLHCVLGLEAKNAAIVLPDADLELAATECLTGSLAFNGQRCTAIKIIFAHRAVADQLTGRLAEGLNGLRFGMPWEEGVSLTPLAEEGKPAWLAGLVEDAKRHGARVMNEGGGLISETYFHPALLYPVSRQSRLYREEQFGPIIAVAPYASLEEPVRYVIGSPYGQQVSLFGRNPDELGRLIDSLINQVGRVNLNSKCQRGPDTFPFVGRKDSGTGTFSVADALSAFSVRAVVAAKETPLNKVVVDDILQGRRSRFMS